MKNGALNKRNKENNIIIPNKEQCKEIIVTPKPQGIQFCNYGSWCNNPYQQNIKLVRVKLAHMKLFDVDKSGYEKEYRTQLN